MLTEEEVLNLAHRASQAAEESGYNLARAYYEGAEDAARIILGWINADTVPLGEVLK